MREYILTKTENKILETFVKEGVKVQDFRTLIFRIRKAYPRLKDDLSLIDETLAKLQKSQFQ